MGRDLNLMNERLGFKLAQIMMEADTVQEIDQAMAVVNNMYPIIRERLEVLEEIKR